MCNAKSLPALFLFVCLLLSAAPAWTVTDDMRQLQETGVLRIGVLGIDAPPFVFERGGELCGADVDMARDFAEQLGLRPEFIRIPGSYNELVEAVAADKVDMGISELTKTVRRAQRVLFSRSYMTTGFTLLINRVVAAKALRSQGASKTDEVDFVKFLNAPGYTIDTVRGSAMVEMMQEFFSEATVRTTTSWLESAEDVYNGKVDAALLTDSSYLSIFHAMPSLGYKVEAQPLPIKDALAIAVQPKLPDLLRLLNDYVDVTADKRKTTLAELVNRYFGESAARPPDREPAPAATPAGAKPLSSPSWLLLGGIHALAAFLLWLLAIRRSQGLRWLLSPWAVIGGMVLGGVTGVLHPGLARFFSQPAGIYMDFWRLCVLPIMIATVVTSIYRLLVDGGNSRLVRRLLVAIPVTLMLFAVLGVMVGVAGKPGADFPEEAQSLLVKDMSAYVNAMEEQSVFEQVMQMGRNIVPDNALKPIVENKSLAVLFVALSFGIMLARCDAGGRKSVVKALDTILEAFTGMIRISLYLLPLALYALALDFTAQTGLELLGAILKLALCMGLGLLPPLFFSIASLRFRLRIPIATIMRDFGPMFLVAFSARSSVIAMPLGLEALKKHPVINRDQAMAAFPLALLLCHAGETVFFSLTPVFIGQVFQVHFTLGQYAFIVLGAVLSTTASAGTIGMSFVLLLSIVCGPLGLPLEPAVMVGMALIAIIDPLNSAVQAMFGCGMASVLVDDESVAQTMAPAASLPLEQPQSQR